MSYEPIENHGVIGDLETCALVAMDGSIDFLCYPSFDSPSVFAALLDDEKGGRFRIAPALDDTRHKQIYLPDSNVLLTRFLSQEGVAEISDFMPVEPDVPGSRLVRRVKTIRGEIHYRMLCAPRFDYARAEHDLERVSDGVVFTSRGPDRTVLRLRASVPVELRDGDGVAEFALRAGEHASFVLELVQDGGESPAADPRYVAESFKSTVNYWRAWLSHCTYDGRWREIVTRSALTLKLLTSREHGSIVAAATFGLPEAIGGVRNWDYRYTWIRDASFTLYAFNRIGFYREAEAFMAWIQRRCTEEVSGIPLRIMYAVDGRHELPEQTLPHLEGYRGSAPVRIGNGAYEHLQLDIFGELLDAVYLQNKYGQPVSFELWRDLVRIVDWVCANWNQPDEGIWEVRGPRQHFLYSRLMCWVAIDRALRISLKRSFPARRDRWRDARDAIYHDILTNFWDPERRAFVQHKGGKSMDASALVMPLVLFCSPTDPLWLSTLRAIREELIDDTMVYRYRIGQAADDGLPGEDNAFTMCSFWYVECLARAGDLDNARLLFEKLLGYANHLGLYAEELGPRGEHLGNYPQALTHLALISAAYNLDRRLRQAGRRE